jgi:hypothetical protein
VKNPFLQPKPGVLTVDDMAIERVVANGAVIDACGIALKVLSGKLAHDAGMTVDAKADSRSIQWCLEFATELLLEGHSSASSRSRLLRMQAQQRGQPAPSMSSSGNAVLERPAGQH